MKLSEIVSYIEALAPKAFQESYDNSGLILGGLETEVYRVLVCLDGDDAALNSAIENQCQLLLSHHPVLFRAVKILTDSTREGNFLTRAIKHDVALYSAHTNYDSAKDGLTDALSKKLGLSNIQVLKKTTTLNTGFGFGRFGEVSPVSGALFMEELKNKLCLEGFRWIGLVPAEISRVAIYNGSYDREILEDLRMVKPDVFVTGDLKYHDAQELLQSGIFTVDAGHYGTESLFVDEMAGLLERQFPELILIRHEGADIFKYTL